MRKYLCNIITIQSRQATVNGQRKQCQRQHAAGMQEKRWAIHGISQLPCHAGYAARKVRATHDEVIGEKRHGAIS